MSARRSTRKDNLSFNSQLSGAESGDAGAGRNKSDMTSFFAGNSRANYSMQVYLTVVIVVGLVLWFVIPAWFLFTVGAGGASSGDVSGLLSRLSSLEGSMQGLDADYIRSQREAIEKMLNSMKGGAKTDEALLLKQTELERKLQEIEAALKTQAAASSGALDNLSSKFEAQLSSQSTTLAEHSAALKKVESGLVTVKADVSRLDVSASWSGSGAAAPPVERPNFALGCAGARVMSTSYPYASPLNALFDQVYKWTDIRLNNNNPPWQLLSGQNEPGQCWCFDGQEASVTIKLLTKMVPDEIFMYHIFLEYYRENNIDRRTAAPKTFRVWGIGEAGQEWPLGDYEYDIYNQKTKGLMQTFKVQSNADKWIDHIKVEFLQSHWGPTRLYTCAYQFGVHGKGSIESE